MAKSRKKVRVTQTKVTGPGRTTRTQSRRTTTTTTSPDVEIVQEKAGLGYADGVAIMTTLVLLAAILMLDYVRGTGYGAGMFFKP